MLPLRFLLKCGFVLLGRNLVTPILKKDMPQLAEGIKLVIPSNKPRAEPQYVRANLSVLNHMFGTNVRYKKYQENIIRGQVGK